MLWFGSSSGVAISNLFHQAKDTGAWLRGGWHVAVAYVLGFFVLLYTLGWTPHPSHKETAPKPAIEAHH